VRVAQAPEQAAQHRVEFRLVARARGERAQRVAEGGPVDAAQLGVVVALAHQLPHVVEDADALLVRRVAPGRARGRRRAPLPRRQQAGQHAERQ
jgi:hypothetical protein